MLKSFSAFTEKWIWKTPEPGPHRYNSVEELDVELRRKDAFLQEIWKSIYYGCRRLWDCPGDTCRAIKWRYQRSVRGYSDCDVWGMHNYLAVTIVAMLKDLSKNKMGYPTSCCKAGIGDKSTHEDDAYASAKWDSILDSMLWTFETAVNISDSNWVYPNNWKSYTKKEKEIQERYSKRSRLKDMHWMTTEEIKRYHQGWTYFKQYFYNLWD